MEKQIETYLRSKIKQKGGLALKFISPGTSGVMDRIVLLPKGIIIFIETKSAGKALRPLQVAMKRKFESLGFRCEKIDSKEQVNNLIKEYDL